MLIVPALEYEKQRQDHTSWNKVILYRSINSMLGVMSHFDAHRLSRELFYVEPFLKHGYFSDDMTKYYLNR